MRLVFILMSFLLAVPAFAQVTPSNGPSASPFDLTRTLDWPTETPEDPVPFGRAVAADFTGDFHADFVSIADTDPGMGYGPAVFEGIVDVPRQAVDLAVIKDAGPRDEDAVLTVSPTGLELMQWNSTTLNWDLTLLGGPEWQTVDHIRTGDIDNDGKQDVAGISSNGQQLYQISDVLNTAVSLPALATPAILLDFELLDWDQDAAMEWVAWTRAGLHVYRFSDGTNPIAQFFNGNYLGDALAVFQQNGYPGDRIAFIGRSSGASPQELHAIDAGVQEIPVVLGQLDVVAAVAGDLDRDGLDDLVLSHQSDHTLIVLTNRWVQGNPTRTSFVNNLRKARHYIVGPHGVPAPDNEAWPALHDFDNDGDLDIIFAVASTATVQLLRNAELDHTTLIADLLAGTYLYDDVQKYGALDLNIDGPDAVFQGFSHLEITVWKQPLVVRPTELEACRHDFFVLDPVNRAEWFTIEVDEPQFFTFQVRYLEIRLVNLDHQGRVTQAQPSTTVSFSMHSATTLWLVNFASIDQSPIGVDLPGWTPPKGGETAIGSGAALMPGVPPFGPGNPDPDGPASTF